MTNEQTFDLDQMVANAHLAVQRGIDESVKLAKQANQRDFIMAQLELMHRWDDIKDELGITETWEEIEQRVADEKSQITP